MTTMRPREFRFPVKVAWEGGRRTRAVVNGKVPLQIAPPPEFKGTDPDLWSPEDAFVVAASSCLAVTIAGLAARRDVPLLALSVEGEGIAGQRPDGRFGFIRIEQTVTAETDDEHADVLRELIAQAEETCLVAVSLDLPVDTTVKIAARVA